MKPFLLCLFLFITASTSAQQTAADPADEAAVRAVALKYFETWAAHDLDGHMALWTGLEQDRQARRESLQRRFAEAEFSFTPPVILRVQRQGLSGASLFIKTQRRAVNRQTQAVTLTAVQIAFTLVKEDVWRITREDPLGTFILSEFLNAKDADLASLLESARTLATPEVLELLVLNSDRQFASGQYPRALKTLRLVLTIAETLNDKAAQASAWQNTGIGWFFQRDYKQALAAHQRALLLERQLGRKTEIARVLISLALTHATLQQPVLALNEYQQALALYEALNERGEVAHTLEAIGTLHYEQGDYVKALVQFRRGLEYLTPGTVTHANLAVKAGRVAYELGNDVTALEHYRRALDSFDKARRPGSRGFVLHSIANIFYNQGDLAQALQHYQLSLQSEERAGNVAGIASALQGIGLVHVLNGDYALALPAYERNLAIWQADKDKGQQAAASQKVAGTRYALGDYAVALLRYEQTLKLREELGAASELASALLDVGIAHLALNHFAEALQFAEKSRVTYATLNAPAGVANALLNIALAHYLQKDFTQALAAADEAAQFAKQADNDDLWWRARYRAGKCQQGLQQLPLARQAFDEAITLIEKQRVSSPGSRSNEAKLAPYQAMVDVLLALNQGGEAFHYSERAKLRSLLTTLRAGRAWITNTMTVVEQRGERRHLDGIALFGAQLAREKEKQTPIAARVQDLTKRLQQARRAYDTFLLRLYRLHPQLKTLRGEGKALTATQAASLAANEKRALLAFSETEERVALFVFVKEPGGKTPALKVFALGTNRADLYQRLTRLQAEMNARADVAAQLRELYDELLQPAQAVLQGKTQLTIAPDGFLWDLPFAALRNEAGHYLIEEAALSFVPSLSASQVMSASLSSSSSSGARPAAKTGKSLLAFANPALSEDVLARLKTRLQRETFNVSAETEREVAAIGQLFDPARQRSLFGTDASEQRAKREAAQARWLHFAAPAVLDEVNPLLSGVALATENPPAGDNDDGVLTMREVLALRLNARLTVLSATETAPARLGTGRALTGTSWSFFIAGCPALLLNQWPVEGASKTQLMQEFYRQQPLPARAQAWQTAVRALWQHAEYRHPYYWAGFKLLGEGWK